MNKNKKRRLFTLGNLVIVVLLLVMIISGIGFVRDQMASKRQRELEESLAQLASQTETGTAFEESSVPETTEQETEAPYVSPIDFDTLRQKNPDTVGWIRIPGTRIDYPIVQTTDNDTYLHRDFDGNDSVYGAVYLDFESKQDFSGWNNPIYGHHMKDGSMFKDVVRFKEEDYFKEHQYFEIYTPERTIHLKAVSCYFSDSSGIVRKTRFNSQESFDKWTAERLSPCSFALPPEESVDSMFVLVTCSYEQNDARTLLFAVEVDENGDEVPATGRNVPALSGADGSGIENTHNTFKKP